MRERAVRMVFESEQHTGSRWEAICSVAEKLGPTPETVRKWVLRVEIDEGRKPGLSTDGSIPNEIGRITAGGPSQSR
jgi:transposase-like protein